MFFFCDTDAYIFTTYYYHNNDKRRRGLSKINKKLCIFKISIAKETVTHLFGSVRNSSKEMEIGAK